MDCLKISLTENSYSRQIELTFADCDRNQRVRPAALLRIIADIAGHDYNARGLTHEKLLSLREVFLLSRVSLHILRCPQAWDVLTVTTWENGAKGAHLQRFFEMTDQTGRLCVSAKSDWILVDPLTRHILRPSAFTAKPLGSCPKAIDCPDPKKLPPLAEDVQTLASRQVVWSDLDGNGHLYSARYGDIVLDALPASLQTRSLREFYINYSREATLGEVLTLLGSGGDGTYRLEGRGPGGLCFSAMCIFQ